MATGNAVNSCGLQIDAGFSVRGAIRINKPDSALGCFNSEQYCEGQGRGSAGEFRQFLGIARGSNCEVQTQLEIARTLNFGNPALIDEAEALSDEVRKMLFGMLQSVKAEDC